MPTPPCNCDPQVLALVPDNAATAFAVADGLWSANATWQGGVIPGALACVIIPVGRMVTQDIATANLKWIRVDGTLNLAAHLNVETLVVNDDGFLNVAAGASVTWLDPGPIDRVYDPLMLSRGLLTAGKVTVAGTMKTPWTWLATAPKKGDKALTLAAPASGWNVGDMLLVPGVVKKQDEEVIVASLSSGLNIDLPAIQAAADQAAVGKAAADAALIVADGAMMAANAASAAALLAVQNAQAALDAANAQAAQTVAAYTSASLSDQAAQNAATLANQALADAKAALAQSVQVGFAPALAFDHIPAVQPGLPLLRVPVGNLTRDIVFQSQSTAIDRRGHAMFMTNDQDLQNAEFRNMGRTDKSKPLNDSVLDAAGKLVAGTGTNQRGRYAVHFHKCGGLRTDPAANLRGLSVTHGPGWGIVNHGSYVKAFQCIGYDFLGACFYTENGSEIGGFDGCLAVRSLGDGTAPGAGVGSRAPLASQDFGHEGFGFWLTGFGMSLTNNVAVGAATTGYLFYGKGLIEPGTTAPVEFLSANLPNPSIAGGKLTYPVGQVPLAACANNQFAANTYGLQLEYLAAKSRSVLSGFAGWSVDQNIRPTYSSNWNLDDAVLYGSSAGIAEGPESVSDNQINNPSIVGAKVGIYVSPQDTQTIIGGLIACVKGISVPAAIGGNRNVIISGVQFVPLPAIFLAGRTQYSVYLESLAPVLASYGAERCCCRSVVMLDGQQLYSSEQAAGFIPFPVANSQVPTALVGLTNQQLWSRFGLAIGGAVAPAGPAVPGTNATTGPAATYLPTLSLVSAAAAPHGSYTLIYKDRTGVKITQPSQQIVVGVNALVITDGGQKRTFFVTGT